MSTLIKATGLSKRYGDKAALDNVSFEVQAGQIVGLIGPNGAGKTTALKAILGLTGFEGELSVLGHDPREARHALMADICFIADVAVLPRWLRVDQALQFVGEIHPRFNRERAEAFLAKTEIPRTAKVSQLSKGMVTQLHLALVMAIDAKLLVLDEPTLGLDIINRKAFYETLLGDYFDGSRTIVITTHQVEEIERILTHLMFINHGRIVLESSMEEVASRYVEVQSVPNRVEDARALNPIQERDQFGKKLFIFEDVARERLRELGEVGTPSIADIFVAKMKGVTA